MVMEFLIGPYEKAGRSSRGGPRSSPRARSTSKLVPTLSYATTRFSYWFGPRKRSMKSGGARRIWVELSGFGRFPWRLRMGNNPCDQCLIPSDGYFYDLSDAWQSTGLS